MTVLHTTHILSPKYLTGFSFWFAELKIRRRLFQLAARRYKNPADWVRVLKGLDKFRRKILGDRRLSKVVQVGDKYFFEMYTPGFPSKSFDAFMLSEMERIVPTGAKTHRLGNVLMAITKTCNENCVHCFEGGNINQPGTLPMSELKDVYDNLIGIGVSQIHLGGGEPMTRPEVIIELLKTKPDDTEVWIVTNGYGINSESAATFKKLGLAGIIVSIDHYLKEEHNQFRNQHKAFDWAVNAVKSGVQEGLPVVVTCCVTREKAHPEFLNNYMQFAKSLGASFVQLLEPVAVGNFEGEDVNLSKEQLQLLDEFFLNSNYEDSGSGYPLICYHAYYQRNSGCLSAGNRSVYVDTEGNIHSCPFCRKVIGSALENGLENKLNHLALTGCQPYGNMN